MQPNQPQTPGSNPYDFITNPSKPPKSQLSLGGDAFMKRIFFVVGGAVLLMIVAFVVLSLFGGAETDTASLKNLAVKQQELVRVAAIGAEKSNDATLRAKAKIIEQSTTSQLQSLTSYLEKQGVKLNKEELAAGKSSATDKALDDASSSNQFDEVFNQTLTRSLSDYLTTLQSLYKASSDETLKTLLNNAFTSTSTAMGSAQAS